MVEAVTSTAPPDRTRSASDAKPSGGTTPDGTTPTEAGLSGDNAQGKGTLRGWPARLLAAVHRPGVLDVGAALLFALFALWITAGLWPDPGARVMAANPEDQTLYEWFLSYDTRLFLGDFGLVSDRLNAPDGVNLMANTTVIALGAMFAPITLIFGVPATFATIALTNLAGTALAWYLLFARVLRAHRLAALIGGAFCGFAPGIVSQNNSHLHMTAQWLVPVMVWCVVRMLRAADRDTADNRRVITSALLLAGLVTAQVFIGEEVLFLTALTLLLMTLAYAAARPSLARRAAPRFLGGMLLAVVVAGTALAYPLWMQFSGPQSVSNGIFSPDYFSADLASWTAISPMSLAGSDEAARLTTGPAEYNTFLGWPLVVAAACCAIWMWRRPVVIATVFAGLFMAGLSLGPKIVIDGVRTDISGPYALLHGLPVIDGALPMRFALPLIPLIATILVLALDRALVDVERTVRVAVPVAVVAALLPIAPSQIPTIARQPVPEYFSAGHWKDCVPSGGVLVPVPLPTPREPWTMRWGAAVHGEFALPEGFFIGPYGSGGRGSMGTYKQPTSNTLEEVWKTGEVPQIGEAQRAQARHDLVFWRASCVVLADGTANVDALRATLEGMIGPGTRTADAWEWKVPWAAESAARQEAEKRGKQGD